MKAPGGRINNNIVETLSPTSFMSKIEPFPSNSLILARSVIARVNPIPIPRPSRIAGNTLFFWANASALPRIIQFTTIRGMKIPKVLYKSGVKAFITRSTTVTNDAMIRMKAAILTLSGIKFFNNAIKRLEQTRTNVVAAPIPIPLIAAVVTASVGHAPNT